jgi:hypothetical protein
MRQHLTSQELEDHFTPLPEDTAVLGQKTGANRLGCAILLKCLQWEGRFPAAWQEVPRDAIHHLAQIGGIPFERHRQYDLDGRLARYHKDQIRQWTGFRPGTTDDAEAITAWACDNTRVEEATASHLASQVTERYQELKIELPTPLRLDRLAHSAVQTIEGQFFTELSQALTPAV